MCTIIILVHNHKKVTVKKINIPIITAVNNKGHNHIALLAIASLLMIHYTHTLIIKRHPRKTNINQYRMAKKQLEETANKCKSNIGHVSLA